jgi:hypothetical protein
MDVETVQRYLESLSDPGSLVAAGPLKGPLRARRHNTIFIAENA